MSDERPSLFLIVRNQWVVENLCRLGVGAIYHLAFHPDEMDPRVLLDIQSGMLGVGAAVELIYLNDQDLYAVAQARVHALHDFLTYFRFDLRICSVGLPIHLASVDLPDIELLCGYC